MPSRPCRQWSLLEGPLPGDYHRGWTAHPAAHHLLGPMNGKNFLFAPVRIVRKVRSETTTDEWLRMAWIACNTVLRLVAVSVRNQSEPVILSRIL